MCSVYRCAYRERLNELVAGNQVVSFARSPCTEILKSLAVEDEPVGVARRLVIKNRLTNPSWWTGARLVRWNYIGVVRQLFCIEVHFVGSVR